MRRGLRGSYTVEATFVLAVLFFAIVTLIKAAYRMHDETIGAMVLHEAVENIRHQEEADVETELQKARSKAGLLLSWEEYGIQAEHDLLKVIGTGQGGNWNMKIQMKRYNPEGFLRMLSLMEEEDGN